MAFITQRLFKIFPLSNQQRIERGTRKKLIKKISLKCEWCDPSKTEKPYSRKTEAAVQTMMSCVIGLLFLLRKPQSIRDPITLPSTALQVLKSPFVLLYVVENTFKQGFDPHYPPQFSISLSPESCTPTLASLPRKAKLFQVQQHILRI
jgi:hypothetical protein